MRSTRNLETPYGFIYTSSNGQNAQNAIIKFENPEYDPYGIYDVSTGYFTVTDQKYVGVYTVKSSIQWGSIPTSGGNIRLYKDGIFLRSFSGGNSAGDRASALQINTEVYLGLNQYIYIYLQAGSATTLQADIQYNWISVFKK